MEKPVARLWPFAAALLTLAAAPPPPGASAPGAPASAAGPFVPGRQPGSADASNTSPANTHTLWAPSLPVPMIDEDAPPAEFLKAAARAIATGHTGEAQEAMERAESRALDRSVRPSKAGMPSRQVLVNQIAKARQALAAGDRLTALQLVQAAAAAPDAKEPE
jgi:hypothetical protein